MRHEPNATDRLTQCRAGTSSMRCQTQGGRKGGLLDCERKTWLTSVGIVSARISGKLRADKAGTKKLQHREAQGAMDFVLSHGGASGGQQSGICGETDISAETDMSITSVGFRECAALPAIGRIATEKAIITASMVRPMHIAQL